MWVSLIEKAVSKLFGSYEDIEKNAGSIKDDLSLFTGAPTYEYAIFDQSQDKYVAFNEFSLHKLLSELSPEALVIFSSDESKGALFRDKLNKSNLFGYTLLSYDQKKKELRLRNPWGWYKEPSSVKGTAVKSVSDEGEFTISLNDMVKYFDMATIANYREENWSVSQGVKQLPNNFSAFSITLTEPSEFYLTFTQLDKRYFRNNLKQKYDYSFVRILVCDAGKNLIVNQQGTSKDIFLSLNQPAGT